MTRNELFARYDELAATKQYIVGFAQGSSIYSAELTAEEIAECLTVSACSSKSGGGMALRFKPDVYKRKELINSGKATAICDKAVFESIVQASKYNRGEIFEKLITERAGQVWEKDSVPFWVSGDININGTEYQIKFHNATFTNEKTLERLAA